MAGKIKIILVLMLCIGLLAVCVACNNKDQVEESKEVITESSVPEQESQPEESKEESIDQMQKADPVEFAKEILAANPEISETELRVKLYKAGFTPAEIKAAAESVMPKTEESKEESSKQDESSKTESSSEESKKEESSKKDESAESTETEDEESSEESNTGNNSESGNSSKVQESSKQEESSKQQEGSKAESSQQQESKQESSKPEESSKQESSKPAESSKIEESSKPESSQTEESKPESQTTGCDHNWVDVTTTVHHDAVTEEVWVVDKEAWDEEVVIEPSWDEEVDTGEYCYQCLGCGAKFDAKDAEEALNHCADEGSSYWSAPVYETVHHPAVTETRHHPEEGHYETRTVQEAWDETVVTGQKCSKCGEEK